MAWHRADEPATADRIITTAARPDGGVTAFATVQSCCPDLPKPLTNSPVLVRRNKSLGLKNRTRNTVDYLSNFRISHRRRWRLRVDRDGSVTGHHGYFLIPPLLPGANDREGA